MLHAAALSFPHPDGGAKRIEAPIPADMEAVMRTVGLPLQGTPAGLSELS
jgi:tRNA pseudouridine32 synthase/23S rRNA pseudouridine746 synthase